MPIGDSDIRAIARLARLDLPDDEVALQRRHISTLMEQFDRLQRIDVEGVEPTSHCVPMSNVMRDDVIGSSLTQEQVVANAPEQIDGCFAVPRILED